MFRNVANTMTDSLQLACGKASSLCSGSHWVLDHLNTVRWAGGWEFTTFLRTEDSSVDYVAVLLFPYLASHGRVRKEVSISHPAVS